MENADKKILACGERNTSIVAIDSTGIEIFDTTLRDGAQGEGISFSLSDKIAVVKALDELGIAYIEAGNPGSNPKDIEFFKSAKKLKLKYAQLCAFGSTRKKNIKACNDEQLKSLLDAGTDTVVIFGKSSALHVREVLKTTLEENIAMIGESVEFLVSSGCNVFFDAEHFFDGIKQNEAYTLKTIKTAAAAGASRIILCDTNGGTFPCAIKAGVKMALNALDSTARSAGGVAENALSKPKVYGGVCSEGGAPPLIGIHCHNDCGLAVADSIAALEAGCIQVQGTLLGFGERCGNTKLSTLIPNIELKLGRHCLPRDHLNLLFDICRRVAETANTSVSGGTPFVGDFAFSHKAGMHADAILKARGSFEHIDPALVGNGRHFLMSEQGGRSAIAERVKKIDPKITKEDPRIAAISKRLKELEALGWAFDGADASFEILVHKILGSHKSFFKILAYRVQSEHPCGDSIECCHAWIKVLVDGQTEVAADEGDGPVNALDGALRRALLRFYPELKTMRLSDYKVRVIDGKDATAAKVRVLIESKCGGSEWITVGVSTDILEASCIALVDSIEYKLLNKKLLHPLLM